jgi:sarcosine oxidase
VRSGERVDRIEELADAVVVHAAGTSWRAATVVVAAGAWAPGLLPPSAVPPLLVTKEQVAYYEPRSGFTWPCFIHRSAPLLYGLPTPTGRIKVGEHQTGPIVDPDRRTFELEPVAWQRLVDSVPAWVPGVAPEPVAGLTCLYATTATDDFVLHRVGRVVVAAGLGGHGFKFGPALGRVLADLVDGRPGPAAFALGAGAASGPGRSGAR